MTTYFFKQTPKNNNQNGLIATALNGVIYTENNRLHVKGKYHHIYKFDGSSVGWYMRNPETLNDVFLGAGASPTVELEGLGVIDVEYWAEITEEEESAE